MVHALPEIIKGEFCAIITAACCPLSDFDVLTFYSINVHSDTLYESQLTGGEPQFCLKWLIIPELEDLLRSALSSHSDGPAALVGAGDPRGRDDQQRRAHDPQPDGTHKARVV